MKLEIKLKNSKYCDGCPLLCVIGNDSYALCRKGNYGFFKYVIVKREHKYLRPKKCIKENGK